MWILKISCLISLIGCLFVTRISYVEAKTHQILVDSDIDTDDLFAILYLLKQDRTKFKLKAITISANAWTDAGHAVNQLYDILYMMDRDDVQVGVGGEGGILPDGTILPNVGGYLPLIDQGISTIGGCRYRQAIPVGLGGRLDIDTNFGFRRGFLPQGERHYSPLFQPTAQQVMIDTISSGRVTVFLIGTHTNFAIFLMTNPHLRKNIEHIYIMGGGIRSKNPTGCCPQGASTTCKPRQCGDHGNLFTGYTSNPYAEFNMFGDPFAAYQVFHSGLPITLVPLDATNTIPVNEDFFKIFKQRQDTYESQYVFKSLKITRDTWFDNQFYTSYFMWDSFTSGIAVSIMNNASNQSGENEFSEMEYMNITVITSNQPYNTQDGSNPFFNDRTIPKFNLSRDGVHSGHVQSGLRDPFCFKESGKGICQDGYTKEVTGPDSVRVLVATKAKPNQDKNSQLNREFFKSFLDVLNRPKQSGKFNITTQFLHYRETLYKPDFSQQKLGKDVIFDMDMSVGDFLSLIYLLKVPVNEINLKGILVNGNGWANAGTIDVVYDILHMMGRDDIPVGLGSVFALGEANPSFSAVGDCKYTRAIPYGRGGFLDSDTLFGFSRTLPRSPRRYTAENSVKFGAPRNTDNPELRQPLAIDVWRSISGELSPSSKFTVLTSGPLTNLANIILSDKNASSIIQDVYIVGGYIRENDNDTGNLFSIPSNKYAEFNFFLDPLASKAIMESDLHITLIPLNVQRRVSSFPMILKSIMLTKKTPEAVLSHNLLSSIYYLQQKHHAYKHMEMFLGEILGAVIMSEHQHLNTKVQTKKVTVTATGDISKDGQIIFDKDKGKSIKIVKGIDTRGYYHHYASALGNSLQSAKISSFKDQKKMWSTPGKN